MLTNKIQNKLAKLEEDTGYDSTLRSILYSSNVLIQFIHVILLA